MPRVSALRSAALRDLAREFRFASRKNAIAALAVLDTLAERIDPEGAYASRWLVHELTGYTPDANSQDAIFPGDALIAELSAFAEHISVELALRDDEIDNALSVEDLAARWSVSRRTIERYRRQGLVARRVGDGAAARLLFTPEAVDSFERRRTRKVERAGAFARTTQRERDRFIARARRYRAHFGWSLTQTAARIALRTGRSAHAVRAALLAHDRASSSPIFVYRASIDDKDREAIMRALRRGVPLPDLAHAKHRSRESVARIGNERLVTHLREFDLRAPVSPTFQRPDAAEVLLAPAAVRTGLLQTPVLDAAQHFAESRALPAIDTREESALAVALSFLRFRASRTLASLPPHAPSAAALDSIETDLRWASRLVIKLARTQRRIALASLEERVGDLLEHRDEHIRVLHLAAMRALCDAALRYDPARQGRLAARSAVALTHALSAAIASIDLPTKAASASRARRRADRAVPLADWTLDAAPWSRFVEPDPRVRANLDSLDERSRRLLTLRFGFAGDPPVTRASAAETLGLHPPAAGALEREALRTAVGLTPTPALRTRYPASR
jgi:RNA polymerase primary sigma factor